MWNSVGRSGHHRQHVCNGYDDWDEISENGHQYKNPITMGTRDLSGADYWHLRKQNRPTEEIPMHLHMRDGNMANLAAYDEPAQIQKKRAAKPKASAFERTALADRHYSRLEQLSTELDAQLENGELSLQEWGYARKQLDKRLDAGWARLCLCRGWSPAEKDAEIYSLCVADLQAKAAQHKSAVKQSRWALFAEGLADVMESLSDDNTFKKLYMKITQ